MIHRRPEIFIAAGHLALTRLFGSYPYVTVVRSSHFSRVRTGINSARAAVVTDVADANVVDARVVGVVDDVDVYVCGGAIVVEVAAVPAAAIKARAGIAEAVINAAVKSDMRSPITDVPVI